MAIRTASRRLLLAAAFATTAGCRQDMHDQPKYLPLRESTFFADGSSARQLPAGTVARGQLREDTLYYTGKEGEDPASEFPIPVDAELMARGQVAYNAFCAHCHGYSGGGDGMVVQRGFTRPPALYDERLKAAPVGYIFEVITNGFGAMPDHASQVKVRDRWAIAAYVRALQASASGTIEDVPPAERERLNTPAPGAGQP